MISVFSLPQILRIPSNPDESVISFRDSDSEIKADTLSGWHSLLPIFCDDIVDGEAGFAFTSAHAKSIIEFGELNRDRNINIHCTAGMSGSVAAGVFLSGFLEQELKLFAVDSTSFANSRILRLLNREIWNRHFN